MYSLKKSHVIWKLQRILLNEPWVKKDRAMMKCLEMNDSKKEKQTNKNTEI